MTEFDYEVVQRKRLARQAKYRKCGSKSKKCSLSTDRMTRKQWEERCGEVMTYQLRRPITWKEFREMPIHIQKMYIEGMISTYHTTANDLAKMFGVSAATIHRCCGKDGLQIKFTQGKHMNQQERAVFEEFLAGNETPQEDPPEETAEVPQQNEPDYMPININCGRISPDMCMTEFCLNFAGKFDKDMLYNSLASMLPAGTNVNIEIHCTLNA